MSLPQTSCRHFPLRCNDMYFKTSPCTLISFFICTNSPNPYIIALEFVQLCGRNANFRLKCWKQMLQNRLAILGRSYIQCCTLQTFLNVRVKLYTYTLSLHTFINLSFIFLLPKVWLYYGKGY